MTTGDCAKDLNRIAGERLFTSRGFLEKVEDGELACVNPKRKGRERAKISRKEFLRYVQVNYPEYYPVLAERYKFVA